jgi:hypothetical protein
MRQYQRIEMSLKMDAESTVKFKNLRIDIKQMWKMKWMIIPVVTGATGVVTKCFKEKSGSLYVQGVHFIRQTSFITSRRHFTARIGCRMSELVKATSEPT